MKKLLTALGCAMALVALPASAITLSMTPSTQQTTVGGSASVDVVVSGLSAAGEIVSGWDINIGFDPAVLGNASVTFNDAPFGGVDFLGFDNVSTPGDVAAEGLSFLLDADLGLLQGDSLTLFSVSFEGLSDGFSLLSFGADPCSSATSSGAMPRALRSPSRARASVSARAHAPSIRCPHPLRSPCSGWGCSV